MVLVAVRGLGDIVGYGDVEPDGHLDHLYCHPDAAGTGVGAALYRAIEGAARQAGIGDLFVEASEGARGLFSRQGFKTIAREQVVIDSVRLHRWRMMKSLTV